MIRKVISVLAIGSLLSACAPVSFGAKQTVSVGPASGQGASTTPPTPSAGTRDVVFNYTVAPADNQVDILLVVDDSNSMYEDNLRLAQKLSSFVADLASSGMNWQMCVTTTDTGWYAGGSIYWYQNADADTRIAGSTPHIMNGAVSNQSQVFVETMKRIGAGWGDTSNDERGIQAMNLHLAKRSNGCYRSNAALAVILISDEDERSIGGDISQKFYDEESQRFTLEPSDLPQSYVDGVIAAFGAGKKFSVNSIIIKPGDSQCMATQDSGSAKGHYGFRYAELSQLTGGSVGSICDADYSQNLQYFKNAIQNSLSRTNLECEPVGSINVTLSPPMGNVTTRRDGQALVFEPAVPQGTSVTLRYQCSN